MIHYLYSTPGCRALYGRLQCQQDWGDVGDTDRYKLAQAEMGVIAYYCCIASAPSLSLNKKSQSNLERGHIAHTLRYAAPT